MFVFNFKYNAFHALMISFYIVVCINVIANPMIDNSMVLGHQKVVYQRSRSEIMSLVKKQPPHLTVPITVRHYDCYRLVGMIVHSPCCCREYTLQGSGWCYDMICPNGTVSPYFVCRSH